MTIVLPILLAAAVAPASPFRDVVPGLALAEIVFPRVSAFGDSKLTVLRVDPAVCRVALRASNETGDAGLTGRGWAKRFGFLAVVNAGMFHPDGSTVGFMKKPGFTSNPKLGKDRMVLLFDPVDAKLPGLRLFDRDHDGPLPIAHYRSALQGLRMVDARRQPRWAQQPKQWSTVAVGTDLAGRLLFLHARSPYSVRDFIDQVLALPIGVQRLMYLEGGPEATLYVHAGDVDLERFGSYETGFFESDSNDHAWPLPNALVVESCGAGR